MFPVLAFDDLDELAGRFKAAGVRSVELDPAKVNAPGVWLRVDTLDQGELAGDVTFGITVHLIVPERGVRRGLDELGVLYNTVAPVLAGIGGPTGQVRLVGVQLPGSSTPLPALAIPIDLDTTQE